MLYLKLLVVMYCKVSKLSLDYKSQLKTYFAAFVVFFVLGAAPAHATTIPEIVQTGADAAKSLANPLMIIFGVGALFTWVKLFTLLKKKSDERTKHDVSGAHFFFTTAAALFLSGTSFWFHTVASTLNVDTTDYVQ